VTTLDYTFPIDNPGIAKSLKLRPRDSQTNERWLYLQVASGQGRSQCATYGGCHFHDRHDKEMKRWLRISLWAVAGLTGFAIITFAAFVPSRTNQKIGGRWSSATEASQPSLEESRNISCAAA